MEKSQHKITTEVELVEAVLRINDYLGEFYKKGQENDFEVYDLYDYCIYFHVQQQKALTPILAQNYYMLLIKANESDFNANDQVFCSVTLNILMLQVMARLQLHYRKWLNTAKNLSDFDYLRDVEAEKFLMQWDFDA